jgi:hypothetical protein
VTWDDEEAVAGRTRRLIDDGGNPKTLKATEAVALADELVMIGESRERRIEAPDPFVDFAKKQPVALAVDGRPPDGRQNCLLAEE